LDGFRNVHVGLIDLLVHQQGAEGGWDTIPQTMPSAPVTFTPTVWSRSKNQSMARIKGKPSGVPVVLKTVLYAVITKTKPAEGAGAAPALRPMMVEISTNTTTRNEMR
jgi:hypothetical protein